MIQYQVPAEEVVIHNPYKDMIMKTKINDNMNTVTHAKKEFEILLKHVPDAIIRHYEKEILVLVKKVAKGQSGGSMPIVAGVVAAAVKDLCLHKPLHGVMNVESEWMCVREHFDGEEIYQNNRLSAIFKHGKDGRPYYLDAITFKGQNESCYSSSSVEMPDGSNLGSRHYIKEFPFKPKTFYIDVIETEWADKEETVKKAGGGWWTSVIKDVKQLDEVFEYYDRYE